MFSRHHILYIVASGCKDCESMGEDDMVGMETFSSESEVSMTIGIVDL
jgi:hypothetical protein